MSGAWPIAGGGCRGLIEAGVMRAEDWACVRYIQGGGGRYLIGATLRESLWVAERKWSTLPPPAVAFSCPSSFSFSLVILFLFDLFHVLSFTFFLLLLVLVFVILLVVLFSFNLFFCYLTFSSCFLIVRFAPRAVFYFSHLTLRFPHYPPPHLFFSCLFLSDLTFYFLVFLPLQSFPHAFFYLLFI